VTATHENVSRWCKRNAGDQNQGRASQSSCALRRAKRGRQACAGILKALGTTFRRNRRDVGKGAEIIVASSAKIYVFRPDPSKQPTSLHASY